MKKVLIILIILVFLGGTGFFAYQKFFQKEKVEESKKVITKKKPQINLLELEKRPFVTLLPRVDGHELFITIDSLKMGEDGVEYELEYQAGTMLQGAFGRIDFKEEPTPVTKKLLLGSCSKGKCKYDKDVSGGSLTLYFEGKEDYGVKGEFTLNKMSEEEGVFFSKDKKISLDVGKTGLTSGTFVVVLDTIGLPSEIESRVLAGPVGFFTASKQSIKKADLTFKEIEQDLSDVKILGWDGKEWQEYKVEIDNDSVTARVDQLGTFVLVTK